MVSTYSSLTNKLKNHRHLLNQFTNQWRRDYLLNLQESHNQQLKTRRGRHNVIQIGDVVVLKSDTSKCVFWKLVIVKELLKGNDNQIRAAMVSVTDPRGGTKLLRRSIKHLYPIKVNSHEDSSVPQSKDQDVSGYAPSNSTGSALQPEG